MQSRLFLLNCVLHPELCVSDAQVSRVWKCALKLSASLHMLLVAGGVACYLIWKGLKENAKGRQIGKGQGYILGDFDSNRLTLISDIPLSFVKQQESPGTYVKYDHTTFSVYKWLKTKTKAKPKTSQPAVFTSR